MFPIKYKIILSSSSLLLVCYSMILIMVEAYAADPVVHEPTLKIEKVVEGLTNPIDMTFIGQNDFLVAHKNNGVIVRVTNGTILPETLLDISVANANERGLLGITSLKNGSKTYVFVYFTASPGMDGDDVKKGIRPLGSFVYRYDLIENKLVNPKLLTYINTTAVKATEDPLAEAHHLGGKITIGPDSNIYFIVGDGNDHMTQAQNSDNGLSPDGTSGIIRITQDGKPVPGSPFGDQSPLNLYYAIGIRNGFGIDFDPISSNLWDTEAGAYQGDEINLVFPGFNSGWKKIMGMNSTFNLSSLNIGTYSDPKLVWNNTVTPTDIEFFDSERLGKGFRDDLFVSRYGLGHTDEAVLYHFELDSERNDLILAPPLDDHTVNSSGEDEQHVIVSGLGVITDLEVGPDGYLYLVQLTKPGTIYRIIPSEVGAS
jgi:aldose sugar dehydrogenase